MEQITDSLKSWASILEGKTRAQACDTASMPFIHPHMALMPDAHLGLGATVGSVIPTVGAIMPAAVGVDIGCGMMAVRTQFTVDDIDAMVKFRGKNLQDLHTRISATIPLSAGKANQTLTTSANRRIDGLENFPGAFQADAAMPGWREQLGTLGSGNHFIELSYDEADRVWMFLHSGSRGVGNKLAQRWIKVAKAECKAAGISLPSPDLAYLTEGTESFTGYIQALMWAQRYAYQNRAEMMDRVERALTMWTGELVERQQTIGCHHNYTTMEEHGGRMVYLSRKGAIDAHEGVWGLIPGSMGTRSYIVRGLGNEDALCSAPHGAGRNFSRSAAKAQFTREDLDNRMAGIVWGNSDGFIDEHPLAYKDIDVVMADAADLVEIVHELRQFLNVKGA